MLIENEKHTWGALNRTYALITANMVHIHVSGLKNQLDQLFKYM